MYGSAETDLVVKYYDLAFDITGEAELAWYLEKAKASGGPVLDVACGTGRLAIALAREGLSVTGMDQSVGMLDSRSAACRTSVWAGDSTRSSAATRSSITLQWKKRWTV